MCSIVLLEAGHNVTIYERCPKPCLRGLHNPVVLSGHLASFFDKYLHSKQQYSVALQEHVILEQTGTVLGREQTFQTTSNWDLIYGLLRQRFDSCKTEYMGGHNDEAHLKGRYHAGNVVKRIQQTGDTVEMDVKCPDGRMDKVKADMVIAANGPSSEIRSFLLPDDADRVYPDYIAFRGSVNESDLHDESLVAKYVTFDGPQTRVEIYTVPGPGGSVDHGKRQVEWVWYVYCKVRPDEIEEFNIIFTDTSEVLHNYTLPSTGSGGKMKEEVWSAQLNKAKQQLPPQIVTLMSQTQDPVVEAITDLAPPRDGTCHFMGGKVILVGEALSNFRQHTAANASQAAFHALILGRIVEEEGYAYDDFNRDAVAFAKDWQAAGVRMGEFMMP